MARIKSKRSSVSTLSCKFGGMGKHAPLSPEGADDMCNFRILPNGTLRVRSGYTLKKHFASGETIRGFWEGTIEKIFYCFAVVGNTVYRLIGNAMNERAVGTVADEDCNVHFFVYENTLYLLDGTNIQCYHMSSGKFETIEPYIPLYGFAWSPSSWGEINEEINLLTPKLRVQHIRILPNRHSRGEEIRLLLLCCSADGQKTTDYSFSSGSNKITFPNVPIMVEVGFTFEINESLRDYLFESQMAYVHSRDNIKQLFLWGNNSYLFCAKNVTTEMIESSRVFFPKACNLYFCQDDILFLGDNTHPITTICPFYETLLAFTSDRIWNLTFDKKAGIVATLSMQDIGCASQKGAIVYRDGVIAAMKDGVYLITASPARPEDLFLERISMGVDDKFSMGFTDKVHLIRDFAHGEVWIRDPGNSDGEIWVWNTELKEWYRFDRIDTPFFFQKNNEIGFAHGSDLFLFDRNASTDNGSSINAHYKSAYLDFHSQDVPRRSMRALLCASPTKSSTQILFETEQGEITWQLTSPAYATAPQLHDMRMPSHRYRFLRFTLSCNASHPTEYYKLDIYSRP